MMALPRAYLLMGWVLGTIMLVGTAGLVYWTLAVLIDGSARTGAVTYVGLTQRLCSKATVVALQAALFLFCFGFMVVHLVVIADLLGGSGPSVCNGLLCEVFAVRSGLVLDRRFLLASIGLFVCAPLMSMRSMDRLRAVNILGVTANVLLAGLAAALGAAAIANGSAKLPPMWPQWKLLGSSIPTQLIGVAAVAPVILSSYVGHQGVHPIMPILVPYTPTRMKAVVGVSLAVAAATYVVLALGSVLAFGEVVDGNVLNNMFAESMAPLIGKPAAELATGIVRGGYLISLLGSALLYMYPLRTCLSEVICSSSSSSAPSSSSKKEEEEQHSFLAKAESSSISSKLASASSGASSTDIAVVIVQEGTYATSAAAVTAADATLSLNAAMGAPADPSKTTEAIDSSEMEFAKEPTPPAAAAEGHAAAAVAVEATAAQAFEARHFLLLTYSLLTAGVLVAALVPNIWVALSVIGDCASTLEAFIVPGLVALALLRLDKGSGNVLRAAGRCDLAKRVGIRCVAVLVIGLGVILFANGLLQEVLD